MTNIVFRPLRRQPANDFNRVFGSLFNAPLQNLMEEKRVMTSPVYANVEESQHQFSISLAVPGYEKSEIEIALDQSKLTVRGKKQANEEINYTAKEFDFSSFERAFYLPEDVQADKIEARSENGILYISIPKAEVKPVINIEVK
ncbi:MAG: hypothetical protein RIR48_1314 [Bacteroidota bacterium]